MKQVTKLNIVRGIVLIIIGTIIFIVSRNWLWTYGILCWVCILSYLSTWLQTAERLDSSDL